MAVRSFPYKRFAGFISRAYPPRSHSPSFFSANSPEVSVTFSAVRARVSEGYLIRRNRKGVPDRFSCENIFPGFNPRQFEGTSSKTRSSRLSPPSVANEDPFNKIMIVAKKVSVFIHINIDNRYTTEKKYFKFN